MPFCHKADFLPKFCVMILLSMPYLSLKKGGMPYLASVNNSTLTPRDLPTICINQVYIAHSKHTQKINGEYSQILLLYHKIQRPLRLAYTRHSLGICLS